MKGPWHHNLWQDVDPCCEQTHAAFEVGLSLDQGQGVYSGWSDVVASSQLRLCHTCIIDVMVLWYTALQYLRQVITHILCSGANCCVSIVWHLGEFDRIITALYRTAHRQLIMTELTISLGRFSHKIHSIARFQCLLWHTQNSIHAILHNKYFHLIQYICVVVDGDLRLLTLQWLLLAVLNYHPYGGLTFTKQIEADLIKITIGPTDNAWPSSLELLAIYNVLSRVNSLRPMGAYMRR